MRRQHVIIAMTAAVALTIVTSAAMNFVFTSSLSETRVIGILIGCVCVACDIMKACLPIVILTLYRKRLWLWSSIGVLLWAGLCVFAMLSAFGLVSEERSSRFALRETVTMNYEEISAEAERLTKQRSALRPHRSASELEAAINTEFAKTVGYGTRTVGQISNKCAQAASRTNEVCAGVAKLREELAAANEEQQLTGKIDALQKQARELRDRGATKVADPQKEFLSRLTGGSINSSNIVPAIMALLVELVSAFGLGLLSVYTEASKDELARDEETTEAVPVVLQPKERAAVQDYICERLKRTNASTPLTADVLFGDYMNWSVVTDQEPITLPEFIAEFDRLRLGHQLGILKRKDRYYGIVFAQRQLEGNAAGEGEVRPAYGCGAAS